MESPINLGQFTQALDRIQIFEVGGIKVQVRELEHQLEEVRFVLRMLVTDHERDHLLNLESNHTSNYQLSGGLQAELRRLRAADLIRSKRYIHDMPGDGASFDLSEFVELTDRGRDYLRRIGSRSRADPRLAGLVESATQKHRSFAHT